MLTKQDHEYNFLLYVGEMDGKSVPFNWHEHLDSMGNYILTVI